LGFEMAGGFKTEWFVEKDLYAQAVLKKHWPSAIIYDDITQLDFGKLPKVDILTGGFPCQDISNAGKRAGIQGSRSGLWKYYLKAISELRPRYCLIENVSALLNRGFSVVLADLAEVGYDAEWHSISASAIGAPHRRDRIFILAYTNAVRQRGFDGGQEEKRHEYNAWGEAQRESESASESLSILAYTNEGGLSEKGAEQQTTRIARTGSQYADVSDSEQVRLQLSGNKGSLGTESEGVAGERSESSSATQDICDNQQRQSECVAEGWWAVEPRLGRVAHGVSNRVERIKCLGNAVVPQCVEVFAKAIKEYEESRAFGGINDGK